MIYYIIYQTYLFKSVQTLSLLLSDVWSFICSLCSKMLLLLICYYCNKILSLLVLSIPFISKSFISIDQWIKSAHQIPLLINAFLDLVVKRKENTNVCHALEKAANKTAREPLIRRSKPIFRMSISASLLIFYLRSIFWWYCTILI